MEKKSPKPRQLQYEQVLLRIWSQA
jgi:hypothetical protein